MSTRANILVRYNGTKSTTHQYYHHHDGYPEGERDDTIYITAGKTRIIEIYKALEAGKKLDRRGNEVK